VDRKPNLDHNAIKILRTSQGMSQSQLARALGVSQAVVRDLELGRNQNELQLRFLARLADVLEADLRDIVHRDRDAADPAEDDIRIEALLTYERPPLSAQEISAAFAWTLPRTHHAIRQLRDRLVTGGTRLRETSIGSWKIAPHHGVVSTTDRERLAQARLRKKGLTTTEALVLRHVAAGLVNHTWESKAKRHELMATRGLLEIGLVTTDERGATMMAPKVARSLHIAQ
jgi:transcriptional regulator with XRE-family HTH domain